MAMTLSIKTPYNPCTSIEDINRGAQNMFNREAIYANVIKIELVKWTRPQTRQRITTIMDQAIKQGFLEDCLVNWIKPIHKGGDKKIWYPTMDVSLLA